MNYRRFDHVARSFARRRSRRTFLGSLFGGVVGLVATHPRLGSAAAQQGGSVQGEPCLDDSQCLFADTLLFCAYNGYGSAGSACCAPSGGSCRGSDADCCGPSTCYLGTCFDLSAPSVGEACWQLPGDPDPCVDGAICTHDGQSGRIWGTCQAFFDDAFEFGERCGDQYCEPWQRCCSQCSGVCAPWDAPCGEGMCRSGYACPDDCRPDNSCSGCLSGYCLYDGTCAYFAR